ncbi:MAG: alkaline phosphatase family protein [Bacteroidales bacterium]|nr:alkaline phosphatase family protein [Bacteroidales bacterium]MBN2698175.1 alkaline phosphatase family protein [Bacteroidales bacterium]
MRRFLPVCAAISLFPFFNLDAQRIPPQKPRLVVGITVSGMRYDYLSSFWNKYREDGFKKMATTGVNCRNARYDYMIVEPAAGHATLASGVGPDAHGIVADYWYERRDNQVQYCIEDPDCVTIGGNYDAGRYSPRHLQTRTITDELRVISKFESKTIGISMDPKAAILQTGHTASSVYWLDPSTASWISSSYYMDSLPDWVDLFNQKRFQDIYLEETWTPLLPIDEYRESMLDNNPYEKGFNGQITFPYELGRISRIDKSVRDYSLLMSTPFGNTYTKDFAIAAIVSEELGMDDVTDWINIGFNATRYLSERFSTRSLETEDAYLRLDADLAHFLNFLNDHIGLENVLIYLTAENAIADDPAYLEKSRIPSGYFNYRSSISLLKSYLNAVYGQGEWVTFYYAQQIYLNHRLIEDSRLSLAEFQDRVISFMMQMNGVSNAMSGSILQRNNFTDGVFASIQNSYNQKRSGDVIIYLTPGWIEHSSNHRNGYTDYSFDPHVPLIFYGWKINRLNIPHRVSPADIAPTIAYFLEISAPFNITGKVISEIVK